MNATGTAVSLGYRLLHEDDITTIEKLWPQIWGKLRPLTRRSWSELSGVLERWRHPLAAIPGGVAPETAAAMIAVARRMVEDLASEAAEHPGLALRLQEWVGDDPELEVATDPELEILFPPLSREVDERAAVIQEARELGCRWASERPATMASKLSGLENEGLLWNLPWPGRWLDACHTLAEAVDRPLAWLEALLDHQVHPMAVEPLLRRVGEERPDGWETFLERCLRSDRYTALAVGVALPLIDLPGTLRELAIDGLDPRMTEHLASRGELSSEILRRLFDHEEAEIVAAAIVGTWSAEPQGSIPDDVEAEWRQAVIRIEGEDLAGTALYGHVDFWLRTILAQDGGLAEDWLLARIGEAEAGLEYVSHSGLFAAAVRPLSHEQRSRLLEHVPAEVLGPHLSSMLIQDSPDLYRRYVDRAGNPDSYLWPLLTREPTAGWVEMVRIALARGADPRRIADQAIFPPPGEAFTPSDPAYLRRWETGLQRLAEQPLEDLTEVIRHALARADELRKQADAARRDVQLYGYG